MNESDNPKRRDSLYIEQLFTAHDLGIEVPEPHSDRAIQIFLELGSDTGSDTQPPYVAIAPRRIEMRKGVLLLQMIQGDPESGSIYLYEKDTGAFFMISAQADDRLVVPGMDDGHLTVTDFDTLVEVYGLRDVAASPDRIPTEARIQVPGKA